MKLPEGYGLKQYSTVQPWLEDTYSMKWDGEWHITYEVFRDLGLAFAAVLILIYVLIVAWFRSFITPLIIMAPIPLTLVGILPGHWLFGAFFTATSMIGFIAFGDHPGGALDNLGGFNSEQAFPSDLVDFTVTFLIADTVSAISFFPRSGGLPA